MKGDAKVMWFL